MHTRLSVVVQLLAMVHGIALEFGISGSFIPLLTYIFRSPCNQFILISHDDIVF